MKNDYDVQELLKNKQLEEHKTIEEQQFETGFLDVQKTDHKYSQEQSFEEKQEEKLLSDDIQEVKQEDGVRELKGEVPAEPKYIGFHKKFISIEKEDSSRMIAVKKALEAYHDKTKGDQEALEDLIAACNAYCKGRFSFFKAFRKAGVRLAEVKALREEAIRRRDALMERVKKEEESQEKDARALRRGSFDDKDSFDDEDYWDWGYEYEDRVTSLKEQLIKEYQKENPNPDTLQNLEEELWKRTEDLLKFNSFLKERDSDTSLMDRQIELDMELAKLRNPYQDAFSKKKLEEDAGKKEFREQLKEMAFENYSGDYHMDDADLKQRDKPYNEEELKKLLKEFESFDLAQVSFSNPLDMIRNFRQNTIVFEHVRSIHYQVFRGINHGFSMEDEQIIKLRAKFLAAFEMQDYMLKLNKMAAKGTLDLTKTPEEISRLVNGQQNNKKNFRIVPEPGDPNAFLAKCEEKLREEYEHREENIRQIVHIMEYAGNEKKTVPSSVVQKRAKEYEKNALMHDYFGRMPIRYDEPQSEMRAEYYEKTHNTKLKPVNMDQSRIHSNFLYGKSNEERARLTNLQGGTPEERLEYYKEMIRELKTIDLKELDTRNQTEFYENFERKEFVMQLYTNSKTIANLVVKALEEIRTREREAHNVKIPGPLELPKDFREEFGYEDLDAFIKDMHVSNEIGNTIQTKLDSICQIQDFGFAGAFSPMELANIDAAKYDKYLKNFEAYKTKWEAENGDLFYASKGTADGFVETLLPQIDMININIQTRSLTKEEKKKGKKQQRMTMGVSIFEILEEEKAAYDERKQKEEEKQRETRRTQTEQAKKRIEEVNGMYRSRDHVADELGLTHDDTRKRLVTGYAGPMAHFCGDTEEKSKERMKALMPDTKTATPEEKEAMARELEDAFRVIMDFDLKRLNIKSLTDILDPSYNEAMLMSKFATEFNTLFNKYKDLIEDETVNTKLNMDDFQEVRAKKEFLQAYQGLVGNTLIQGFGNAYHETDDMMEILKWSEEEMNTIMSDRELDSLYTNYIGNVSMICYAMKDNGFEPGADMNQVFEQRRVKEYGAPKEDHRAELKKKLGKGQEK